MDVLVLIDKLDDLVHNAKQVPLTDQVRVDKEEIYDILDQMRATIPEEIKQARWIVKERQEMLAEAKREAERIVKEARERQSQLVSQQEVTRQAERAAEEIIEDARAREREIRLGAEDYADEILNTLEVNLSKFIAAVQRGRERLQGRDEPPKSASGVTRRLVGRRIVATSRSPWRSPGALRAKRAGRAEPAAHRRVARRALQLQHEPAALARLDMPISSCMPPRRLGGGGRSASPPRARTEGERADASGGASRTWSASSWVDLLALAVRHRGRSSQVSARPIGVLELQDLARRYGDVVALDGVSFSVEPGQLFGFVGPNGAGKTTTMRIVLGVLAADRGEVRWRGEPVTVADPLALRLHARGARAVPEDARARPARLPRAPAWRSGGRRGRRGRPLDRAPRAVRARRRPGREAVARQPAAGAARRRARARPGAARARRAVLAASTPSASTCFAAC